MKQNLRLILRLSICTLTERALSKLQLPGDGDPWHHSRGFLSSEQEKVKSNIRKILELVCSCEISPVE